MAHVSQTQKDPADVQGRKKPLTPCEYYNKYIREEGQKVLSEQEWAERVAKRHSTEKLPERLQEYPLTPKDAFTNTGKSD
jgi:hypothetical protein